MGLIYCTTNLINGKKYIGKQINEKKKSYLGSGFIFQKAIIKYGRQNFKKEVLISGIDCRKELAEIERYYIAFYDAAKSENYYNIADGGEGGTGARTYNITPELKQIWSDAAEKDLLLGKMVCILLLVLGKVLKIQKKQERNYLKV